MSINLFLYFIIVYFIPININCHHIKNSYNAYNDYSAQFLENRVDLNDDVGEESSSDEHKTFQATNAGGSIIDKLKDKWNKILHPAEYDKTAYTETLNNLHTEIFNYLNEDKFARSTDSISPPCSINKTSNAARNTTNQNITQITACTTILQNVTVQELNFFKKFLKCLASAQEAGQQKVCEADKKIFTAEKKPTNTSGSSVAISTTTCKPTVVATTTIRPIATTTKSSSKPVTTQKTEKSTSKPTTPTKKPDSGLHSHNITIPAPSNDTQTGKKKTPVDLEKIQQMIDEAKSKIQQASETLKSCKQKSETTSAAPIAMANADLMFPFLNPYKRKRSMNNHMVSNDVDDDEIKDIVSNVGDQLRQYHKNVDETGDSEYSKILGPGSNTANQKQKRKGKKKKKKKKYKMSRESEDGAEMQGKIPMNVNNSKSINNFNVDYNSLKFKVTPEQEEDINKFLNDLNEPPKVFKFDIDQYLTPQFTERNRILASTNHDQANAKSFYNFDDDQQHHAYKRKPGQIYLFDNEAAEPEAPSSKKPRRDILTQRIKAISNKIKLDSFLDHPELYIDEERSKYSRSSEPVDSSIRRNSAPLDPAMFNTDNDFIDKFYLLNDGVADVIDDSKTENNIIDKINPIDLGIDLDLDKKFRDLRWETDRNFYSDVPRNGAKEIKSKPNIINNDNAFDMTGTGIII